MLRSLKVTWIFIQCLHVFLFDYTPVYFQNVEVTSRTLWNVFCSSLWQYINFTQCNGMMTSRFDNGAFIASKVIREVANGPNEHSVHEALGHRASLIRINPYRHLKAHEFAGTSMACCVLFSSAHLTAGFRWNFHQENNRSYYFDLVNWLYFGYQSVQRIHLFLLNQREDKQV